ncbi:unnamed protein product [Adineta steineri]|uniref:F-box domain-containing protein n=1 Tax=Adineta steineri TaxID=433720 RepID=A0A819VJP2_9BILA|nr:unnamed protein product [Adineta steineri]CAF4109292.1 unnamed protein product [Adineta steineri]
MSDEVPSRIEDLPNEIWLEVFDYLDWINLFSAFYGLNKRINEFLLSIKYLSLYSSYLINSSNSIYICFQEFPIKEFKQIQHFQLIYDNPYENELNIAKHFTRFSTLISLRIDTNCGESGCNNEFGTIIFHQHCPYLQRLYLYGNVFDRELQIIDDICTFYFSSLRYIHVNKLPFNLAIQLLDQGTQLRSFSAILYGYPERVSSILLPDRIRMGLPLLNKLSLGEDNYFETESSSTLFEFLFPCCPNLRTFTVDIRCNDNCEKLLDPNWWAHLLASHNRLKRISFHIKWWTRNFRSNGHEKIQRFRSSSFFTELNANITSEFDSDFLRSVSYDLYIKN